jgi:hypothetical protein
MIKELGHQMMLMAVYSPAVPLLILLIRIDRQPIVFRWLAVVLSLSLVSDIGGLILFQLNLNPNLAFNMNGLFSLLVASLFLNSAIGRRRLPTFLILINVGYFALALSNILFLQKSGLNTYSDIFHALFILGFCITFFYKLLQDLPTQNLHKLPLFWIISAFFFSYAGKTVIYTFSHYLVNYLDDDLGIPWTFHHFLTIIGNLVIAYGAWLNHKQLRSTSLSL